MEMTPVEFKTPPYGSPDPKTLGNKPLEDDSFAAEAAKKASEQRAADKDEKMKAGDWKDQVEAANTQEELDDVAQRYADSGSDFSTVADAIEKKQDEINAQSGTDEG